VTIVSSQQGQTRKGVLSVLAIETRCAISTLGLMIRRRLGQPNDLVDSTVEFADGSVSKIYRETSMRGLETTPQVMLAVRFRLRLIGSSRLGHALFRFESLFNTLLFAAHRGFHSKLWLTDPATDYYRGSTSGKTTNPPSNMPRLSGSCSLHGCKEGLLPIG
jgi:hypothetical protein